MCGEESQIFSEGFDMVVGKRIVLKNRSKVVIVLEE
tara:strand:- start:764 stop:871 length:108 start_codon:yes stop_codon:yes gene_type:complete